jgi:hypothetical protein
MPATSMPYRKLGDSGISVSLFSFGSWITFGKQMDVGSATDCIKYAFDHGIIFSIMQKCTVSVKQKSSWVKLSANSV